MPTDPAAAPPGPPDPPEVRLDRLEQALSALGDPAELKAKLDRLEALADRKAPEAPPALRPQSADGMADAEDSIPVMRPPSVRPERAGFTGTRVTLQDEAHGG